MDPPWKGIGSIAGFEYDCSSVMVTGGAAIAAHFRITRCAVSCQFDDSRKCAQCRRHGTSEAIAVDCHGLDASKAVKGLGGKPATEGVVVEAQCFELIKSSKIRHWSRQLVKFQSQVF